MRTSSDVDVLVKPEDLEKAAGTLAGAGYEKMCETAHDVSFLSPNKWHVELHHTLIEEFRRPATAEVLGRVWAYSAPAFEGSFEYRMRDEMFYYYHVAHMVKHFEGGGCGVRSFADLWLLEHRTAFDRAAREELLKEGGIAVFADYARRLSEIWFSCRENDPSLDDFAHFVLNGGVYGTVGQAVLTRKSKSDKKGARYLFSRLFPPAKIMKGRYPALQKRPALLPFYYTRRMFSLLRPKTRRRATAEINAEKKTDEAAAERAAALMKQLEI